VEAADGITEAEDTTAIVATGPPIVDMIATVAPLPVVVMTAIVVADTWATTIAVAMAALTETTVTVAIQGTLAQ
jgi:hypothetical protein